MGQASSRCAAACSPGRGARVRAVGVSALGPCVLPADAHGRPLRPAILYGIDSRAIGQAERLTAELGADDILARCGSRLSSQSVGPKLRWLAERGAAGVVGDPARLRRQLLPRRAPHRRVRARPPQRQSLGAALRRPRERLDRRVGRRRRPRAGAAPARLAARGVRQRRAGRPPPRPGSPEGTPVAAGTIDSWAEVVASGLRGPGSGAARLRHQHVPRRGRQPGALRPQALEHRRVRAGVAQHRRRGRLERGAHGLAARAEPAAWATTELYAEAAGAGPGAGGLLALPYFAGERTPLFDPDLRGAILGLTAAHGRGHVFRALLEAAAFAVRHNLETMAEAGATIAVLRSAGGGVAGALWPQHRQRRHRAVAGRARGSGPGRRRRRAARGGIRRRGDAADDVAAGDRARRAGPGGPIPVRRALRVVRGARGTPRCPLAHALACLAARALS